MSSIDIEYLKRHEANRIERVIEEKGQFVLDKRGRRGHWRAEGHDSFVVNLDRQYYYWNSQSRGGSVIDYLINEEGYDIGGAIRELADRAGVDLHVSPAQAERMRAERARQDVMTLLADYFHASLVGDDPYDEAATMADAIGRMDATRPAAADALRWAAGRGWTLRTLVTERCGFWDGDQRRLRAHLQQHEVALDDAVVVAVLGLSGGDVAGWCKTRGIQPDTRWLKEGRIFGMPRRLFVYTSMANGRCNYFAGRAIDPDAPRYAAFWNPRAELVGPRRVFWNSAVRYGGEYVVVVEGQACATTLGQWEIPAVALAGLSDPTNLAAQLDGFERVYIWHDNDAAGLTALSDGRPLARLAEAVGPLVRVAVNPDAHYTEKPNKDINDLLRFQEGDAVRARMVLGSAPVWAVWLCQRVSDVPDMEQDAAIDRAVAAVAALPEYAYEKHKSACAKALPGVSVRDLNNMARALAKGASKSGAKVELFDQANGMIDGHLFELIWQPDHEDGARTLFGVRYPDGRIGTARVLTTDYHKIFPIAANDSILNSGFIKLPSDLADHVDETALQKEIQAFIHKYVDVPEHIEVMASYYAMMTWVHDAFYVLPYLRARGDSDSGKSRFTETVGILCLRPMFINGATTPSPVFRLMQAWNGMTVVMDEADLPHAETSSDWTMMLNTGYKRGSGILRTAITNGEAKVEAFSAFGPKVVNMRGKFPDDATESRCLTWETSSGRGVRVDIPRYKDEKLFQEEACAIRNKLLRWRLETLTSIQVDYNHEATKHLPGRLVEITVALMSISTSATFKASVMEFVERMNVKAIVERQTTMPAKVLEGYLRARYTPDSAAKARDARDMLSVAHITRQVNRIINRENAEASLVDASEAMNLKEVGVRKVGHYLSNDLNLEKSRSTSPSRATIVPWEENAQRVDALVRRYGFEDLFMELIRKADDAEQKAAGGAAAGATQGGLDLS